MDDTTYLFIDGHYARQVYDSAIKKVFLEHGELDPAAIADQARAFKSFYYDCEDDLKKDSESQEEFAARLQAQRKFFAKIRSLRSMHVQLGKLAGHRPRRQKEVDVLIAVDMLMHGFYKNMTRAVLVSGDLDFRPVVEALVRLGVYVEVWYERKTASEDLYLAADRGNEMDWHALYNWSSQTFRTAHPLPSQNNAHAAVPGDRFIKNGKADGRPVMLAINSNRSGYLIRFDHGAGISWYEHADQNVLERFFCLLNGSVTWDDK